MDRFDRFGEKTLFSLDDARLVAFDQIWMADMFPSLKNRKILNQSKRNITYGNIVEILIFIEDKQTVGLIGIVGIKQ